MHSSKGKSQNTEAGEAGGVFGQGSEVCDSQRAVWWLACARFMETLSPGKLSVALNRVGRWR